MNSIQLSDCIAYQSPNQIVLYEDYIHHDSFCKNHTKCMYSLHMINLKWFERVEPLRTTVKTIQMYVLINLIYIEYVHLLLRTE